MITLSIETSGSVCSCCLTENDKLISDITVKDSINHCVVLFDNIKKILYENNFNISNLNYIAVSNGPGSYTGLRIGVATAMGLAKTTNIKIKYVDTLLALAYNTYSIEKKDHNIIVPMIDAKANRVYTAIYDKNYNVIKKEDIFNTNDLISVLNNDYKNYSIILLGDGLIKYEEYIKNNSAFNYEIIENNFVSAYSVALASMNIEASDINSINYMQLSQAERDKIKNA